jgi:hypothetical protein
MTTDREPGPDRPAAPDDAGAGNDPLLDAVADSYPPELPITERRDDLVAAIAQHQVLIVAGETGSGKSTQLPKLCLEAGRGTDGLIGHTQPRRLAARSIAERVAEELGVEVGREVGFSFRFNDRVGPLTRVKLMTDGILLAELQRDRDLRRYDTIIVDEAHERSLNIDFILDSLTRRDLDCHFLQIQARVERLKRYRTAGNLRKPERARFIGERGESGSLYRDARVVQILAGGLVLHPSGD